ncbi:MAG: glycosyltransferase family 1 protein [Patescibacteria group bacterium]|nr:glycosyltransferase family 1 protein [Patescibacteria group bacterium]
MHIAIDARELRTSSGRYVERLLHYLQQLESPHQYSVLLKPQDMAGWQPSNPNFTKVACPHKEFSFAEQIGFKRQLEQLKPDLVHFTFPQQPITYRGKTVTTIHDLTTLRFHNPDKKRTVFIIKQGIYDRVIKAAVKKSKAVIAISEFTKSDLVNFSHIDPNKVTVTYESADPIQDPPTPLPDLQKSRFIMYVGRPTPHKNLVRLIAAYTHLLAQHYDLKLVLVGKQDANYERIATGVPDRYKDNVVFTGFASEGLLRWLYENCEAYVFPSLSEGFGLPGLEAMLNGAPVVSSDATCLPEIYGDAAHYFDPENVESMADAINEVLTDKELREKLIKNGKLQVEKYSWQRMAEQTLRVYEKALE